MKKSSKIRKTEEAKATTPKLSKKDQEKAKKQHGMLLNNYARMRLTVFGLTGLYSLIMIAITGGIGYWLDQQFDTYPKIFIGGLLAGYPITLLFLRSTFKKYAKKKLQ